MIRSIIFDCADECVKRVALREPWQRKAAISPFDPIQMLTPVSSTSSRVNNPAIRTPRFNQIMQWATDGQITPYVSHTFELADYKQAMLAKWNGKVSGGCVLHP